MKQHEPRGGIAVSVFNYNIDQLLLVGGSWRVTGWVIRSDAALSSATLIMSKGTRHFSHPLAIGRHRPDVEASMKRVGATGREGFDGFGIGAIDRPDRVELEFRFGDGSSQLVDIERFREGVVAAAARFTSRIDNARQLIKGGRYRELARKSARTIGNELDVWISRSRARADRKTFKSTAPVSLIVDHAMGGGANLFAERLASEQAGVGRDICVIRYSLNSLKFHLELRSASATQSLQMNELGQCLDVLRELDIVEIHVNETVSFPSNSDVLAVVKQLRNFKSAATYYYFHDYYSVCPSFTLLGADGRFCGVPKSDVCFNCLKQHNDPFVLSQRITSIEKWRSDWLEFFHVAKGIRFFSASSLALFREAFPAVPREKCIVEPHAAPDLKHRPLRPSSTLTIAIVGTIIAAKGARQVHALCKYLAESSIPARVVIFGTIEENIPYEFVSVKGAYNAPELPRLLAREGVNVAFFSSIWPETYSFVVAELQAMGVPIVAFDLGAPAERISGGVGQLVPLDASPDTIVAALKSVALTPSVSHDHRSPAKICVFTSAATNYLPKAMVLGRSVKQFHPEVDLVFGLCDVKRSDIDYLGGVFDEVIAADELGVEQFESWSFRHSIVELSTAIKPFILRELLDRGYEQVYYFDPDIVIFSRLDDLLDVGASASVVLTPHQTHPESDYQAIIDNEICSLQHGVYNLGFVGVSNTAAGRAFASWWSRRLYEWCVDDIPRGLFTDQRWIDLVPALFEDVAIERSPRFNVSTWNVTTRLLSGSFGEGYTVNGLPLGFYHFTGFDKGAHRIMAEKNSRRNPAVMELVDWYQREMETTESHPVSRTPWAYGTYVDGVIIPGWHRKLYRDRKDLHSAFPQPFSSTESSGLRAWIRSEGGNLVRVKEGSGES